MRRNGFGFARIPTSVSSSVDDSENWQHNEKCVFAMTFEEEPLSASTRVCNRLSRKCVRTTHHRACVRMYGGCGCVCVCVCCVASFARVLCRMKGSRAFGVPSCYATRLCRGPPACFAAYPLRSFWDKFTEFLHHLYYLAVTLRATIELPIQHP